jgi:hypothetical protein
MECWSTGVLEFWVKIRKKSIFNIIPLLHYSINPDEFEFAKIMTRSAANYLTG